MIISTRRDAPHGGGSEGSAGVKIKASYEQPTTTARKIKENITAIVVGFVAVSSFILFAPALLVATAWTAWEVKR